MSNVPSHFPSHVKTKHITKDAVTFAKAGQFDKVFAHEQVNVFLTSKLKLQSVQVVGGEGGSGAICLTAEEFKMFVSTSAPRFVEYVNEEGYFEDCVKDGKQHLITYHLFVAGVEQKATVGRCSGFITEELATEGALTMPACNVLAALTGKLKRDFFMKMTQA